MNILDGTGATRILEAIAGSDTIPAGSAISTSQLSALPLISQLGTEGLTDSVADVTSLQSLDLLGQGTLLQPIADSVNDFVLEVHRELVELGSPELSQTAQAIVKLGESIGPGYIGETPNPDGHTNLVTDVVNAPGDILAGDLDNVVSNIGNDLTQIHEHASDLKDVLIFGPDPANPLPGIIDGVGEALSSTPLLSLNGGNSASSGLLSGIIGDLSGSSSSNHLIDIGIGQPQGGQGLLFDILAGPSGGSHNPIELNLLDVGPTGPTLIDLGVLTNLALPALGNLAADSLVGNLLGGILGSGGEGGGILGLGGQGGGILGLGGEGGGILGLGGQGGGSLPIVGDLLSTVGHSGGDLGILNLDHGVLDLHGLHLI